MLLFLDVNGEAVAPFVPTGLRLVDDVIPALKRWAITKIASNANRKLWRGDLEEANGGLETAAPCQITG